MCHTDNDQGHGLSNGAIMKAIWNMTTRMLCILFIDCSAIIILIVHT